MQKKVAKNEETCYIVCVEGMGPKTLPANWSGKKKMIMKENVVNENSVRAEMQGAYELVYNNENKPSLPIVFDYTGGGAEYLIARYNGETYYHEEENGWYQENDHGQTIKLSEETEAELYKLCGCDTLDLIKEYDLDLIVKMLPAFLKKYNLEIFFENNSDFANMGTYYVCDMGREIENDKENWRKVGEDEYYKIAQLIIGDKIIRLGCEYYQTLKHPEYAN